MFLSTLLVGLVCSTSLPQTALVNAPQGAHHLAPATLFIPQDIITDHVLPYLEPHESINAKSWLRYSTEKIIKLFAESQPEKVAQYILRDLDNPQISDEKRLQELDTFFSTNKNFSFRNEISILIANGKVDLLKNILHKYPPVSGTRLQFTADECLEAAKNGHVQMVEFILDWSDSSSDLTAAAVEGSLQKNQFQVFKMIVDRETFILPILQYAISRDNKTFVQYCIHKINAGLKRRTVVGDWYGLSLQSTVPQDWYSQAIFNLLLVYDSDSSPEMLKFLLIQPNWKPEIDDVLLMIDLAKNSPALEIIQEEFFFKNPHLTITDEYGNPRTRGTDALDAAILQSRKSPEYQQFLLGMESSLLREIIDLEILLEQKNLQNYLDFRINSFLERVTDSKNSENYLNIFTQSLAQDETRILEYFVVRIIPEIFVNSRIRNVKFKNLHGILRILKLNYDSEISLEFSKQEFDAIKRITLKFLEQVIKRFKNKLSLEFAREIIEILQILLEKSIEKSLVLDVLKVSLENIASFGDFDFKNILLVLKTIWNLKKEKSKTESTLKSMELKCYYEELKEFVEARREVVQVFHQMIKHDSSLYGNHDLIAYILHDLLHLRINHDEEEYVDYHVSLLHSAIELLLSNYPKHIFPLVYHCLHKAYYSEHLEIKEASLQGLRMCQVLVNRQSIVPVSFDLPIMHNPEKVQVELEVDGDWHKNTQLINHLSSESVPEVLPEVVEIEEESLFHKPAYKPEAVREFLMSDQQTKSSVVDKDVEKKEQSYISLILKEDNPLNDHELPQQEGSDHPMKDSNPPTSNRDTVTIPLQVTRQGKPFEDETFQRHNDEFDDNDSDDSNDSASFGIPEINIDSSDENE